MSAAEVIGERGRALEGSCQIDSRTEPARFNARFRPLSILVLLSAAGYILINYFAMQYALHTIVNEPKLCDNDPTNPDCLPAGTTLFAPTDESQAIYSGLLILQRFVTVAFGVAVGAWSENSGRRRVIGFAFAGYATVALVYTIGWFAKSWPLFYVGAIILGLCTPMWPHCNAYINDISVPEDLAKNTGYLISQVRAGLLVGFIFSIIILGAFTAAGNVETYYPTSFLLGCACGSIGLLLSQIKLPESLNESHRKPFPSLMEMQPFFLFKIITKSKYLFWCWMMNIFGYTAAGASEAVFAGWMARRFAILNQAEVLVVLILVIISQVLGAGPGNYCMQRFFGLKKTIHITHCMVIFIAPLFFGTATSTGGVLWPLLIFSIFTWPVEPSTLSLQMGQCDAKEKGLMSGIMRTSEALGRMIGIFIFGSVILVSWVKPYTPDASCMGPNYLDGYMRDSCKLWPDCDASTVCDYVTNDVDYDPTKPDEMCKAGQLDPWITTEAGVLGACAAPSPSAETAVKMGSAEKPYKHKFHFGAYEKGCRYKSGPKQNCNTCECGMGHDGACPSGEHMAAQLGKGVATDLFKWKPASCFLGKLTPYWDRTDMYQKDAQGKINHVKYATLSTKMIDDMKALGTDLSWYNKDGTAHGCETVSFLGLGRTSKIARMWCAPNSLHPWYGCPQVKSDDVVKTLGWAAAAAACELAAGGPNKNPLAPLTGDAEVDRVTKRAVCDGTIKAAVDCQQSADLWFGADDDYVLFGGRCTATALDGTTPTPATDTTKTCDLDASTDGTAECPAGCTYQGAVSAGLKASAPLAYGGADDKGAKLDTWFKTNAPYAQGSDLTTMPALTEALGHIAAKGCEDLPEEEAKVEVKVCFAGSVTDPWEAAFPEIISISAPALCAYICFLIAEFFYIDEDKRYWAKDQDNGKAGDDKAITNMAKVVTVPGNKTVPAEGTA